MQLKYSLIMLTTLIVINGCAKEQQTSNPYAIYKFPMKQSFIALSPLPGRVDLESDLSKISENKITHVVTLVSDEELTHYKVGNLMARYSDLNLTVLHSPIPDYGTPSIEQMKTIITWVHKRVKSKQNVLIHCVGGLGRSGTVMAVYAKAYLGKTAEEAINYVRSIRGEEAVETEGQQNFVKDWQ